MLPTKPSLISSRRTTKLISRSVKTTNKSSFQRPAVLIAEEIAVYEAPPFVQSYDDFDHGWAEYQAATAKMKDLEALSAQLLLNLEELNSASEVLAGASLHIKVSVCMYRCVNVQ